MEEGKGRPIPNLVPLRVGRKVYWVPGLRVPGSSRVAIRRCYVIQDDEPVPTGGWEVVLCGRKSPVATFLTKEEALSYAERLARWLG